jgi:hypothetical protein
MNGEGWKKIKKKKTMLEYMLNRTEETTTTATTEQQQQQHHQQTTIQQHGYFVRYLPFTSSTFNISDKRRNIIHSTGWLLFWTMESTSYTS